MPRPTHFEIPAENPESLMAFYGSVFGWTFRNWDGGPMPYWLVITGPDSEPGINGGLLQRQDPKQPCVNTVTVPELDKTLAAAVEHGARIALPRMGVPGVGWLAYCTDPEGHMIGIMQLDPAA
jgi:predicted enzyme related to lactoylglutathione lyase